VAKASRKFTPAPAPAGKIIDAGKITIAGESDLNVDAGKIIDAGKTTIAGESDLNVDARHFRPMDISDWGKPNPDKDLYLKEAERRLKDGEVPADMTLKAFANKLHDWFIDTYPDKKPPAARTIENNIVDLWHRHGRGRG